MCPSLLTVNTPQSSVRAGGCRALQSTIISRNNSSPRNTNPP